MNSIKGLQLLLLAQLATHWPVWQWYLARMTDGADEPWGVVALITAIALVYCKRRSEYRRNTHHSSCHFIVLLYAITYHWIPPLARAALAMLAFSVTLHSLSGAHSMRLSLHGLIFLSLPLIASLQFYIGYPIRWLTSQLTAHILTVFFETVDATGTLLLWRGEMIAVDAPCSGIRMLWTGLYFNFSCAYYYNFTNKQTCLAYSMASIVIFFGNCLRTIVLFLFEVNQKRLSEFEHKSLGVIIFCFIVIAIFSMHQRIRSNGGHSV